MPTKNVVPQADGEGNIGTPTKRWIDVAISGDITDGTNAVSPAEGKTAYDHSQTVGNPHTTTAADVGADPTGTSAAGIASHEGLYDHTQIQNAAKLNGVDLAAGSPTNGQSYAFNSTSGDFELTSFNALTSVTSDTTLSGDGTGGSPLSVVDGAHNHTLADVTDSGTAAALDVPALGDAASGEVVKGDDTRLTDDRTPTTHASTHNPGGADALQDASASQGGLVSNGTQTFAGDKTIAGSATILDSGPTQYFSDTNFSATNGASIAVAATDANNVDMQLIQKTGGVTAPFFTADADGNLTFADGRTVELGDSATIPPLNMTERSAEPTSPDSGDIYLDDGTNTSSGLPSLRRYTGAAWEDIGGVTASGVSVDASGFSGNLSATDTNVQTALDTLDGINISSPLTTKGDLYTYDTADARLPVGTNGQILSASSGTTTGLLWIDNTGGGGVVSSAEVPLSISSGVISLDYGADFATSGSNLTIAATGITAGTFGGTSGTTNILRGLTVDAGGRISAVYADTESGGGLAWEKITASQTGVSGEGYMIDASSGAVTLTLPATPSEGNAVGIKALDRTNTVTVARNGSNIEGVAQDLTITSDKTGFTLVYADATEGWVVVTEFGASNDLVTLTDAATIAIDMDDGDDFQVTLAGNRTMGNPSNVRVGQAGHIKVKQDGTGSRTLSWSSVWQLPGGSAPSLTATSQACDIFAYWAETTGAVHVVLGSQDSK